MGQALYRKHRPKKLSEVVGQEHVTKTLQQALKQGRISHAYLFTGPRGVGKTSIARILAHEINQLPYTDDTAHIDIIEIDAASNRRIDEIRDLREKVYVAPASARYKVYIIDEVHMLTREAFNALLKTLEEPPEHVVFILATTDAHKLPETIVSRTQRFSFKPVAKQAVIDHLKAIAKTEKIKISDEALGLLAEHGEGSFRDSISLLDQAGSHDDKIEAADVQRLLGIPPAAAVERLLELTLNGGDTASLMSALSELYDQGYQPAAIAKRLANRLRQGLVDASIDEASAFELLSRLIAVPVSFDPERYLEIVLLSSRPTSSKTAPGPEQPKEKADTSPSQPTREQPAPAKPAKTSRPSTKPLNSADWSGILQALKKRHNTLYGVVRMAEPDFTEEGKLKLAFAFAFHQKRLNDNANRQKLADTIEELTGNRLDIECLLNEAAEPPAIVGAPPSDPPTEKLAAISNIFGDTELLES